VARRRGRKKRDNALPAIAALRIAVDVVSLEMASGHDGLLRGHPDPAIVAGVYRIGAGGAPATLVGRGQVTFRPRGTYPLVSSPEEGAELVRARVSLGADEALALLAIAVERDGGRDLGEIYAALPDAGAIRLWDGAPTVPSPVPIEELAQRDGMAGTVQPVHALIGGRDLDTACEDDDLVGVCLAVRPRSRGEVDLRLPFANADRANDWTAVLRITVR